MKMHQLTIRRVPDSVNRALKRVAKESKQSLNQVILDTLQKALGLTSLQHRNHDLDALSGSWVHDSATDSALAAQRKVDARDWK